MDKRTIMAIVLIVAIMGIWFLVRNLIPQQQPQNIPEEPSEVVETPEEIDEILLEKEFEALINIIPIDEDIVINPTEIIQTEYFTATFLNKGALLSSIELNKYQEKNESNIEMIVNEDSGFYPFSIRFGSYNTDNIIFNSKRYSENNKQEIEFSKKFRLAVDGNDVYFILKKIYSFDMNSYLIDFRVTLEGVDKEFIPLQFGNKMYSLYYGPQTGPDVSLIGGRSDFRKLIYYSNGKKTDFTSKVKNKKEYIDKITTWLAIEGKYFITMVSPPHAKQGFTGFDSEDKDGIKSVASLFIDRHYEKNIYIDDSYKFYIGPKKKDILKKHSDLYFDKVISGFVLFDWLPELLKNILVIINNHLFINNGIGNWGISILILTLLIKLVFFPLTQKSFKANAKMQALAPKLTEIKEKYKDNPQKIQTETASIYKKEGINPLSGCLPLLIQMPIFIAFYGLLNSHFELRGAVFIPGWISDLSAPEKIFSLPFTIPILNTPDIRLLPFLMLGASFLQQKITQNQSSSTGQMKIMFLLLPVFFFFILYNMSSGLVLYWTFQNIFSVGQQFYINYRQTKPKVKTATIEKKIKKKRN